MSSIKSIREFIDKHGGPVNRPMKMAQQDLPYRNKLLPEFHISFNIDTKFNQFNILKSSPLISRLMENIELICGDNTYQVNKYVLSSLVPDFYIQLANDSQLPFYTINASILNFDDPDEQNQTLTLFANILSCKTIILTLENANNLLKISKPLKIDSLTSILTNFLNRANENIEKMNSFANEINEYNTILQLLLDLSDENFNSSMLTFSNLTHIDKNLIINAIEVASNSKPYSNEILAKFCKELSKELKITDLFDEITHENLFFLYQLYENNLIDKQKILKSISQETPELFLWFSPELEKLNKNNYYDLLKKFQLSFNQYTKKPKSKYKINYQPETSISANFQNFISNIGKFYEDDWKLLKEMRESGTNLSDIANCIKADDLNTLQEIVKEDKLDQIITPSIFERCQLLKNNRLRLIEYAAFFSAVKCFKYLLSNTNQMYNSLKYAVAGGCIEIIRICEDSDSNMINGISTSIQFCQNDIFEWIFDSLDCSNSNIPTPTEINTYFIDFDYTLGYTELSFKYGNIFALNLLIERGYDISNQCLLFASKSGNILLAKLFFALGLAPKDSDCLLFAVENGHAAVLKFILENSIENFRKMPMPNFLFNAIQSGHSKILEILIESGLFDINSSKRFIYPTELMFGNDSNFNKNLDNYNSEDESLSDEDDEYYESDDDVIIINNKPSEINNKLGNIDNVISKENGDDETPLIAAAKKGDLDVFKVLLSKKNILNFNAVNKEGMTPLMIAAENGFDKIVKELIEIKEVDLNIKKGSLSAADIATKKGYFKVRSLLMAEQRKRAMQSSS